MIEEPKGMKKVEMDTCRDESDEYRKRRRKTNKDE